MQQNYQPRGIVPLFRTVLDDGKLHAVRPILQDVVEQGGLAASEKAGEDGDGDGCGRAASQRVDDPHRDWDGRPTQVVRSQTGSLRLESRR